LTDNVAEVEGKGSRKRCGCHQLALLCGCNQISKTIFV